jgi:glutathione S-transferase
MMGFPRMGDIMDTLTLYTNPMSRGRIARWMMEELGQPYDTVILDYGTTMKAPEYLAINPMGKVPAVTHGNRVITEGAAICTYLAEAFPQAGLMPEDRAGFYRWMFFGAGPLEQAVVNTSFGWKPNTPQEAGRVGYGGLEQTVAVLTAHLVGRPFIVGEHFSAADVYVGSQIGWGLQFKTIPANETLTAYWDGIKTRPALARANALDDALLKKDA